MTAEQLRAIVQRDSGLMWIAESIRQSNAERAEAWRRHHELFRASEPKRSDPPPPDYPLIYSV